MKQISVSAGLELGDRDPQVATIIRTGGSPYCVHDYQKLPRKPCTSVRGNFYGNTALESFFKSLNAELVLRGNWQTRPEVEVTPFEVIDPPTTRMKTHNPWLEITRNLRTKGILKMST